jgi:hypothetical protein
MRYLFTAALTAAALTAAVLSAPAIAQDDMGEVIVTAQRSDSSYYSDEKTVIGLRRPADNAVQQVWIVSDSRDADMRCKEVLSMLDAAMARAGAAGVSLVDGDFELKPIARADYSCKSMGGAGRADTSQISFYVKAPVVMGATGGTAPEKRIAAYVKSVPVNGRSLMETRGGLTLTIINPDQYRDEVVQLVAEQSLRYAGYFGPDYGVEVGGLNEELSWIQVSETEVFLYIPYRFTVRPK